MNKQLFVGDLNGICTISRSGASSLLCTGDPATHRPFEALMSGDFNLKMGIPVSEAAYNKAARKQSNNSGIVNHVTLLKKLQPGMFGNCSSHTIEEVTGKKVTWKNNKPVYPQLTVEEEMWCNIAEWAYSSLGTTRNVSVTVSLNNGVILKKNF